MKKTIALVLALILSFSALGMTASAYLDNKTEPFIDKIEETKEVAVTFRTGKSKEFGDSWSQINTVYLKGDKVAYDFNNGFFTIRTLIDGDDLVCYFTNFPFIHMKVQELPFGNFNLWDTIKGLSDVTMEFLVFVRNYETEIDGVKYYVEEFSDRGSVINSFFYVGDELKILKAQDFAKDTIQYTYFDKISLTVDDSFFEMPSFSFDFTVVMKWFISLFVTSK